jgi:vancomycin resistance protein YoaR
VEVIRPALSGKNLHRLDISTLMGWAETEYHSRGKYIHRTHNLRVAARKLNGSVIMPKETFSFNEALGPRTEREGYRVAPVISAGEMVDGMAGGTCQISSTLFAAAYFAGLEVIEADVHSQPSHYIELGLDATVVWPDKDLKLRNPYDFPVVIHYDVNFRRVRTEILGARRLYRIGFERRILRQSPYKEVVRPDPEIEKGERKVDQRGEFGYAVRRRRIFFDKKGNEIKSQYRTVIYPPTTMIVRLGSKPPADPLKPIPELRPLRPKPVPKRFVRIIR